MPEFLSKTFYGNTVGQWAIALAIGLGGFVAGKTLHWFIRRCVRKVTASTKTQVDDFVVDTIDGPLVVIVTVLGLWIGAKTLTLSLGVRAFLWNATQAAIVLAGTWMVARIWDAVVKRGLSRFAARTESDLDDQLLPIVRRGGRIAIWVLGLILALNNVGYDVGALIAGLGIGGLALAMAAKDTVSNVFGGFTIFTDRPFGINDRIVISGIDGVVSEVGIRRTRLRKLDGREVTIPNSRFVDSPVENVSREPSRKVVGTLCLAATTPAAAVESALEAVGEILAAEAEHLVPESTRVGFDAFGASGLDLGVVYNVRPGHNVADVRSRINVGILQRLDALGIERAQAWPQAT